MQYEISGEPIVRLSNAAPPWMRRLGSLCRRRLLAQSFGHSDSAPTGSCAPAVVAHPATPMRRGCDKQTNKPSVGTLSGTHKYSKGHCEYSGEAVTNKQTLVGTLSGTHEYSKGHCEYSGEVVTNKPSLVGSRALAERSCSCNSGCCFRSRL